MFPSRVRFTWFFLAYRLTLELLGDTAALLVASWMLGEQDCK
jgi:hypothetical protein